MSSDEEDKSSVEDRLREFIGSEFGDVSEDHLSDALEEVSESIESEAERDSEVGDEVSGETMRGTPALARTSSGSYERVTGSEAEFLDSISAAIEPFDMDREGGVPLVTVTARDDEELSRIFGQVLDVEAFWLKVEDPPPLNETVEILLDIPQYGYEGSLSGRVVHRTDHRVAVSLAEVSDEDIESIQEVFERHQFREHQKDTDREVALDVDSSARGAGSVDVTQSWDGSADSSFALSRTFETVSEEESYWYGPRSQWLEPEGIGTGGEVRRDIHPEDLLLDLSERAFTGLVELDVADRQFQLFIEDGHVAEVSGRPHEEREELGPMLRVANRVSEDELAEASSYAIKEDLTLQKALSELGYLSEAEIAQGVAGRLTYMLRKICDLGAGTAQWTERSALDGFPLPDEEVRVRVAPEAIVFRRRIGHYHDLSADERNTLIEESADLHPVVSPTATTRIERAFVDDVHRAFIRRKVDGALPLEDLIVESFLPPAETVAVLFALRSMDLLSFESNPAASRAVERYEDDLEIQHLSVHKASYFEVLNVHWSSYDEVIDAGYERRCELFDPDDAPTGLPRKSERRLAEISERLETAYRVLEDRKSRDEYRRKIMPEYKIQHGVPLLMHRGRLAAQLGEHDVARDSFRRVLEIDPGNREASAELQAVVDG